MPFRFGAGDLLAVPELAWKLDRYCYVFLKGAPQDFPLLLQDITTLSQSIRFLEVEAK